ncbi:hypothetical protein ACFQ0T_08290 [Kitasatospora gansuensis]
MTTFTRLTVTDLLDHAAGLGELLADAVVGGASVGFLDGFTPQQGERWWRGLVEPVKGVSCCSGPPWTAPGCSAPCSSG